MILCDRDLLALGPQLLDPFNPSLVNPASIDIRVGDNILVESEYQDVGGNFVRIPFFSQHTLTHPWTVQPKEFILVETLETLKVPNGYAVEMKLKSSRAREGWNHSLAFWFDPGWYGVGTMELHNVSRFHSLKIYPGLHIAQIIVHRLSGDAINLYNGRYQNALTVERSKE